MMIFRFLSHLCIRSFNFIFIFDDDACVLEDVFFYISAISINKLQIIFNDVSIVYRWYKMKVRICRPTIWYCAKNKSEENDKFLM